MASTITKMALSTATTGAGVALTATTQTSIHVVPTLTSGSNNFDEVWLYAANTSTTSANLTVGWPSANITVSVPGQQGLLLVVPGLVASQGSTITATAATASVINVFGFVNRIQQ